MSKLVQLTWRSVSVRRDDAAKSWTPVQPLSSPCPMSKEPSRAPSCPGSAGRRSDAAQRRAERCRDGSRWRFKPRPESRRTIAGLTQSVVGDARAAIKRSIARSFGLLACAAPVRNQHLLSVAIPAFSRNVGLPCSSRRSLTSVGRRGLCGAPGGEPSAHEADELPPRPPCAVRASRGRARIRAPEGPRPHHA